MSVQTQVRAGIMVGSVALMVLVGGRAAFLSPSTPDAPATQSVAATSTEGERTEPTSEPTSEPTASPVVAPAPVARPTLLALAQVKGAKLAKGHLLLRGQLTTTAKVPVVGRVTLSRKGKHGKWVPVLVGRVTMPDGTVRLEISQSARRDVYRLAFAGDATHAAHTSATLTVVRH